MTTERNKTNRETRGGDSPGSLLWLLTRAVAVAILLATAATLLAPHHWFADLLANLRIQQCLAILVMTVLLLVRRRWAWLAMCILGLAIHLPWLIADSKTRSVFGPNAKHLTVTLANVNSRNQRYSDILADVASHQPDVLVILELNSALAAILESGLGSEYQDSVVRPMDDGNFGIGLYSRHPLEDQEVFKLNTQIESISAKLRIDGQSYRIIATHPFPPIRSRGYRLRNEHLNELASVIRAVNSDAPLPTVLVGDLNLTPWSPHFKAFETACGLRRGSHGFNLTPTWYCLPAFPFGLVLDHALVSNELKCTRYLVGSDIGSDHRAVTVTLTSEDQ